MKNSMIITNAVVIDGKGNPEKACGTVMIENGVLTRICYGDEDGRSCIEGRPDLQVIDVKGKYLLPGLMDCHLHLNSYSKTDSTIVKLWYLSTTPDYRMIHGVKNLKLLIKAGFTTVRHCGHMPNGTDIHLRDAVSEGLIPGPRVLACGGDISMTAGHGDLTTPRWAYQEPGRTADGVDECIKAVRQRLRMGADFIKVHMSGGVMSIGDPLWWRNYRADEFKAICDEAHDFRRKVAAHAHGTEGIKIALRNGVDTVEHGTFMDDEGRELMLQTGAYLIPTLVTSHAAVKSGIATGAPVSSLEKAKQAYEASVINFQKAYHAGVKIANGSDCQNLRRVRYNREEFDELANAGVPNMEIITIATHNAADALDILEYTGTIEEGKDADLIILCKNPLEDISVLGSRKCTEMVMKKGNILIHNFKEVDEDEAEV